MLLTLDGRRGDGSVSFEVQIRRDVIRSEAVHMKLVHCKAFYGNFKMYEFHLYHFSPYYISPYLNFVGNRIVPPPTIQG